MRKGVLQFPLRLNRTLLLVIHEPLVVELVHLLFPLQVDVDVVADDGEAFPQVHVVHLELSHLLEDVDLVCLQVQDVDPFAFEVFLEVDVAEQGLKLLLEAFLALQALLIVGTRVARAEHAQDGEEVDLADVGQLEEEVEGEVTSAKHHELQRLRQDRLRYVEAAGREDLLLAEVAEALELVVLESLRRSCLVVERSECLVSHY